MTYLSVLIQRGGRAARGRGRTGLFILLAEPSAYNVNPTEPGISKQKSKNQPGQMRQQRLTLRKGRFDSAIPGAQPELREDSPAEGAYALCQTKGCRRIVWRDMFKNPETSKLAQEFDLVSHY